jgi:hypothetical protein
MDDVVDYFKLYFFFGINHGLKYKAKFSLKNRYIKRLKLASQSITVFVTF